MNKIFMESILKELERYPRKHAYIVGSSYVCSVSNKACSNIWHGNKRTAVHAYSAALLCKWSILMLQVTIKTWKSDLDRPLTTAYNFSHLCGFDVAKDSVEMVCSSCILHALCCISANYQVTMMQDNVVEFLLSYRINHMIALDLWHMNEWPVCHLNRTIGLGHQHSHICSSNMYVSVKKSWVTWYCRLYKVTFYEWSDSLPWTVFTSVSSKVVRQTQVLLTLREKRWHCFVKCCG